MRHDYEAALRGIDWKFRDGAFNGAERMAIMSALLLAQEAEQVRKEEAELLRVNAELLAALKDLYDAVQSGGYPHNAMIRTKLLLDRAEQSRRIDVKL